MPYFAELRRLTLRRGALSVHAACRTSDGNTSPCETGDTESLRPHPSPSVCVPGPVLALCSPVLRVFRPPLPPRVTPPCDKTLSGVGGWTGGVRPVLSCLRES